MKSFSLVPTSEGPRREFKITWGLRAGYGPSGRIYDLEDTIRAAHRWTRERDARAEPFLSRGLPAVKSSLQARKLKPLMIASPSPSLPARCCRIMRVVRRSA
jgi:hypothetical protein